MVYAVGADLQYFKHTELNKLPTRPIRGQTLQIKPNKDSLSQNLTLVEQGYFTPVASNVTGVDEHMLGATFQAKEILPNQEEADTDALFKELQTKWYPSMTREQIVSLRVGFRLSTPDKLPLIGPVCDEHWMRSHYEHCFQGAKNTTAQNLEPKVNEWMLLGLGSRGITFSSLGAELLAALMCNEPLPIEADLWEHLHTARFFIRKLKKKDKL